MARVKTAYILNELEARLMTQFELAVSSHERAPGEDAEAFTARLVEELPEIFIKAEGQAEIAGLVFNVPVGVIEDLTATYPEIERARDEGFSLFVARKISSDEVAGGVKRELLRKLKDEDPHPVRKEDLPLDPQERFDAVLELCPHYLRCYSGCKDQMAGPMSVPAEEIQRVIDSSEHLIQLQSVCQASPKAAAIRNLQNQAATGGYAAAAKYLEKCFPEEFGPKQEVKFKGGGFEPPPAGPPPNVLFPKDEESE